MDPSGPIPEDAQDVSAEHQVSWSHAHDNGDQPHHHGPESDADPESDDTPKPKPQPKPNEEAKLIGLWADVKRDVKRL
jgi:hypothetical protein